MRKLSDLMKDYGFRDDANEEVAEAFIRNLIRSAYGVDVPQRGSPQPERRPGEPTIVRSRPIERERPLHQQLSFVMDDDQRKPATDAPFPTAPASPGRRRA